MKKNKVRRLALCSLLTTLALVLSLVEKMIPLGFIVPIPGIKLGLANVVTLFALTTLARREAIAILVCRVTLGALFAGSITGLAFSLLGGLLALAVMAVLLPGEGALYSLRGVSIAGAAAHNIGQILAAMLVLGTTDVMGYLPLLLVCAIPLGLLTGIVCQTVLAHIKKIQIF